MHYLVKYTDTYDFGNRMFRYFDNEKEFDKYINELNNTISEEMKLGRSWTSYKVYQYSSKDSVIDTLLNSMNHSVLNVESDIVADVIVKD